MMKGKKEDEMKDKKKDKRRKEQKEETKNWAFIKHLLWSKQF